MNDSRDDRTPDAAAQFALDESIVAGEAIALRPVFWTAAALVILFLLAAGETPHSYESDFLEYSAQIESTVSEGTPVRRVALITLGLAGLWGAVWASGARLRLVGLTGATAIALGVWCYASLAWSTEIEFTLRRLIVLTSCLVAAVALVRRFSPRELLWLGFIACGLHLLIDVLGAAAFGFFRPWESVFRFTGFLFPNYEAVLAGLCALSALALARHVERGRAWLYAAAGAAFVLLVLTKSRTSLIATLAGFALARLLTSTPRARLLITSAVVATVALGAVVLDRKALSLAMEGLMLNRQDSELSTLSGRLPLWEDLTAYAQARLWSGYGYSSFWTTDRIGQIAETQGWVAPHAHSDYVEMLLSTGLVGLGLMLLLWSLGLFGLMRLAHQHPNQGYDGLCDWLCFMVFGGLADCMALYPSLFQLLFFAALLHVGFRVPGSVSAASAAVGVGGPTRSNAWRAAPV